MSSRHEITVTQLRCFQDAAGSAEDGSELAALMTFSLVGRDEARNSFGSVMCSSSPAGAARCAHLADGVGAAHTQNITDPRVDWSDDPLAALSALLDVWLPQRADYIDRALRPESSPGFGVPGDDR